MKKLVIFIMILGGMILLNSPPTVVDAFNNDTEEVYMATTDLDISLNYMTVNQPVEIWPGGLELKYPEFPWSVTIYNTTTDMLLVSQVYPQTDEAYKNVQANLKDKRQRMILAQHMIIMSLTRLDIGEYC